jgi:hypothetical protein
MAVSPAAEPGGQVPASALLGGHEQVCSTLRSAVGSPSAGPAPLGFIAQRLYP